MSRPGISKFQVQNQNIFNIKTTPNPKELLHSQTISCLNHYDKIATHKLIHPDISENYYYCQKCAIMMASKGNNIVKLQSYTPTHRSSKVEKQGQRKYRQAEISKFMQQLSWNIFQITQRNTEIQHTLRHSQQHFNSLISQVTSFYKQIQDLLQIQKYLNYNSILTQRSNMQSELRLIRQSLQAEIQELMNVGNDIKNNMEAVQTVETPIYLSIMNNYRVKLDLAYQYHQIQIQLLERPTIVFPQIPKIVYSLGEKLYFQMEQQSEPQRQKQNYPMNYSEQLSESQQFHSKITNKSKVSRNKSVESQHSRQPKQKLDNSLKDKDQKRTKKSFTCFIKNDSTDEIIRQRQQLAFSFQPNQFDNNNNNNNGNYNGHNKKQQNSSLIFFEDKNLTQSYYPQQVFFRQSLTLTQICENDEESGLNVIMNSNVNAKRRQKYNREDNYGIILDTLTSHESLGHYFVTESTELKKIRENSQPDQAQTLLIC